jgi:glutamine synthetase
MLAAGLQGNRKKYRLGAPANDNIYHMGEEERQALGIRLPSR